MATIPEIETERLVLRGLVPADVDAWAAHLVNPEDFRFMPWKKSDETPRERAERVLAATFAGWETDPPPAMGWMFTRKADGEVMGFGELEQIEGTNEAEIAYRLGKPFWGQGYAGEAARAMTRFAFENTDWSRIIAYVVPENAASVRVAERLGMTYDGTFDYREMLGDTSEYHIASWTTAVYAVRREQFDPGHALYVVRAGR